MIISCPSCRAGFFVSPEQIGATGRRVKCSKCKDIWYATLPQENFLPQNILAQRIDHIEDVPGSNLPAIIPIKISKILFITPACLVILIFSTIWMFFPSLTSRMGMCGSICVPSGIRIENIYHEYNKLSQTVLLEYNIVNRSTEKQRIPSVELKLFDKAGTLLRKAYTESDNIEIEPNASIKGKATFDSVSSNAQKVTIALGSKLKFWLR